VHIGIDVGGTFTDLMVSVPGENRTILHKLPSTPDRPDRAIIDGVSDVLSRHSLDPRAVVRLSHGTTVGTNALIQRRCGKVALVTSDGFRDLLEIGRQTRPRVYDIHLDHPKPLVDRALRLEVPERRLADGSVFRALDEERVRSAAEIIRRESVDCVAVCFLHSYAYPDHENRAVEILEQALPSSIRVIASSAVYPEFREFERFSTAVLNGALLTTMGVYLDRLTAEIGALGIGAEPKISQSAGGLMSVEMARRYPIRASLSGPAAGVLGAARRAEAAGFRNIITLDVGGTSAAVSLLREAQPTEVHERALAGFPLRLPALDVNAVGAGGGSIAWIDQDGLLKVGPRSAGAVPGPACYDTGGTDATVTDANVVLGRLNDEALLDGQMPIDKQRARDSVGRLAAALELELEQTALGIVRVACATMVKAIRSISIERGHNPSEFALFVFGGAGPLHSVDVARELDIGTVIVPLNPGILCAEGALTSALRNDFVRTLLARLDGDSVQAANAAREALIAEARAWFDAEQVAPEHRSLVWTADLRYIGQNYEIQVPWDGRPFDAASCDALTGAFHEAHERQYGFASGVEEIQFVNLKVKTVGTLPSPAIARLEHKDRGAARHTRHTVFDRGETVVTPVYRRDDLAPEQIVDGPAIIEQLDSTVIVFPGDRLTVDPWGNLVIRLNRE
ncbi:MAG: hydantoinase/oxoprolinase family protein, partial [Gammaproteobacteria bacterium]